MKERFIIGAILGFVITFLMAVMITPAFLWYAFHNAKYLLLYLAAFPLDTGVIFAAVYLLDND